MEYRPGIMEPDAPPLIATIVLGIGLAFILGTIANRLRVSPLVGYLLAGVVVGPFTPGFIADQNLALQLAEIGVILLMFGVGLHFSINDLLSVRATVIPGALLQAAVAIFFGVGLAHLADWPSVTGLVFGIALSVSSTVVLTRALQERRLLETGRGHIAVGWTVFQDLLTVFFLLLLPPLATVVGNQSGIASRVDFAELALSLTFTGAKMAGFIAFMMIVGRRAIPMLLHYVAHTGSRELFRLAVLSVALGVAFTASQLFDVSFALGAFVAGMTLHESALSQVAAEESLPLRDAFAVLFFVSVGMLFDPMILVQDPLPVVSALLLVLVVNPFIAFVTVRILGGGTEAGLLVGVAIAQIGEFSFILANLGIWLGVFTEHARQIMLATSIISILLNPLAFAARSWWLARTRRRAAAALPAPAADEEELPPTSLTGHVVLIGYGRVGRLIGPVLRERSWPLLVIENADDAVERLRTAGIEIIQGNAADPRILRAANLPEATLLFVAIPDAFEAGQIVEQARAVNPRIEIVARAHFDAEVEHLLQHGANTVVMGEREIARTMLELARTSPAVEVT
ncbi:MAG: YbaL family putative K(+) efflux transporter [Alphaproteobacteria bacterium]